MLTTFVVIIIVAVVLLLGILFIQKSSPRIPSSLDMPGRYPNPIPAPPAPYVVSGVDVRNIPGHIHDEDTAMSVAMMRGRDFADSINYRSLSLGTSGSGFPGFESNNLLSDQLQ